MNEPRTIPAARRRRQRAGWVVATLAVAAVAAAALAAYARQDYRPRFARAAGELVAVRDSTDVATTPSGLRVADVTLVSDTGLEARLRVRSASLHDGVRRPAILLLGGYKTGRRVADIPPDDPGIVLASLDYPYDGPERPRGWQWLPLVPRIRRATLETPPMLLLAMQYLYARDDVNPESVVIMGVSLGVPFATIAAATDRRAGGAVLIYGGGDIQRMFASAFAGRMPDAALGPISRAVALLLAPLEPTRYAAAISPRPLLMINGTSDETIPQESVRALWNAARQPKRLLWIDSRHVATREEQLIAELMDETMAWIAGQGLR